MPPIVCAASDEDTDTIDDAAAPGIRKASATASVTIAFILFFLFIFFYLFLFSIFVFVGIPPYTFRVVQQPPIIYLVTISISSNKHVKCSKILKIRFACLSSFFGNIVVRISVVSLRFLSSYFPFLD